VKNLPSDAIQLACSVFRKKRDGYIVSLLAALKSPLPGSKTEGLYQSALARQRFDWLVGMNMSRAVTLRFRQKTNSSDTHSNHSIGRVKTPTFKLVYDPDEAIRNFVSQEFFELGVTIRAENDQIVEMMFRLKEEERILQGDCRRT
jgi:DNA topoisomerase III